jgi:hypothetical protein
VRRERYTGEWLPEPLPDHISWNSTATPTERTIPLTASPWTTCRQLATSARRHIRSRRHRSVAPDQHRTIVSAFKKACETGDFNTLIDLLDPQVTVHVDGGGKVRAARRPILGPRKTARYLLGLLRKEPDWRISEENVNGRPGLVVHRHGRLEAVIATEAHDRRVTGIWMVLSPDRRRAWGA